MRQDIPLQTKSVRVYPFLQTFGQVLRAEDIIEYETKRAQGFHHALQAKISNRESCKQYLDKYDERLWIMTPQEELHAQFFNDEAKLVFQMSDSELESHREKLARIAFEARARLTAVEKDKERRRKGIKQNLEDSQLHTDAINKIQKSVEKKKLSKEEKTLQSLMSLGMSKDEAMKLIWSPRTDNQKIGEAVDTEIKTENKIDKAEVHEQQKSQDKKTDNSEAKPNQTFTIDDPFAKKG